MTPLFMNPFGFVWTLLTQPSVLMWGLAAVAAVAVMFYLGAGKTVLKLAMDVRVWLVVAAAVLFLSVGDIKKQNTDLKRQLDQIEEVQAAKDDGIETQNFRQDLRTARGAESNRIRDRIIHAEPDQAVDSALDEIATIQDENAPDEPDDRGLLDRLLDRKQPDGAVGP